MSTVTPVRSFWLSTRGDTPHRVFRARHSVSVMGGTTLDTTASSTSAGLLWYRRRMPSSCKAVSYTHLEAAATTEEEDASVAEEDMIYAEAGGSITLPEGVAMPEENNAFVSQLNGDTLAGAFKNATSNYKTTGYFTTGGSITVTVSGELFTDGVDTRWKDATFSLWKQGENTTHYVSTVHWTADGTTQTLSLIHI